MHNKRGQGLSTNAIILIVLGVFVLAILILGFTLGWGKIAPWISTNNVDDVVTACNVACSTNSQFDFCSVKRDLKADSDKFKDVTCNYLSKVQKQYGVGECSTQTCSNILIVNDVVEPLGTLNAEDCIAGPNPLVLNKDFTIDDIYGKTIQNLTTDNKLLSFPCPVKPA